MITCTRRIQFSAGHRVYGHENKCANLHGHNYVAFFHAHAPTLDSIGRVIDFSVLKHRIGSWIDEAWDHSFLFWEKDQDLWKAFSREELITTRHYTCSFNPTAENMAHYLLNKVCPTVLADTEVMVHKVVLWETENCFAEASLEASL